MKTLFYAMALLCMLMASGCASQDKTADEPLTPMPIASAFNDPDNEAFMGAVTEYVRSKGGPGHTQYEFTRLDLNGDGRREGIVLMKTPHQYWCGFNGCSMVVFQAHNNHFELKSEIAPVRGPLTVSYKKTNGWNDIIVHVSGRMNAQTKDVALKFDGQSYPPQPAFQPAMRFAYNMVDGIRIFP